MGWGSGGGGARERERERKINREVLSVAIFLQPASLSEQVADRISTRAA